MGSSSAIWLVLWGIALPTSSQIEGGIDVQKFPECQCMPLNSFTLFQAEVALFKSKLLIWQEIQEMYSQNLEVYTSTSCLFWLGSSRLHAYPISTYPQSTMILHTYYFVLQHVLLDLAKILLMYPYQSQYFNHLITLIVCLPTVSSWWLKL